MKIDIWSDIVCPFCYIGMERLMKAIEQFGGKDDVEIRLHSFLLSPGYEPYSQPNVYAVLAEKYGITFEQAEKRYADITMMAKLDGLHIDFDNAIPCNTVMAHQLLHLAWENGRQLALEKKLFQAYFSMGEDLNDVHVLAKLCAEVDIDRELAIAVCEEKQFISEINDDIARAKGLGIDGVPFIMIDDLITLKGALPAEDILKALNEASIR